MIKAGDTHTCAMLTSGGVKCWGNGVLGQVGDTTNFTRLMPVDVYGLASGAAFIALGYRHTCAATSAGSVKCWGWNGNGQLGDGTNDALRIVPVDTGGLTSGVAAVNTGGGRICVIGTSALKCVGNNSNGQLGDNSAAGYRVTTVDVFGLGNIVAAVSQ